MESSHAVAIAASTLLLVSVVCDLRTRTIPDWISVALVVLGAAATTWTWHDISWSQLGVGAGLGFAIGAALFYLGAMGGGDAKLCAGIGAVCGWPRLLEVLFATALFGGLLSYWAKRRGQDSLPYAPAIAAGYLTTMVIGWTMPPKTGLWHLITGSAL